MNACAVAPDAPAVPYEAPRTGNPVPTPEAANDQSRAVLTLLGGIPLVTPVPIEELSLGARQRIDRAELRARAGLRVEASRMIVAIEAALGVTTDDRIEAMKPKDDLDMALEAALKLAMASIEVVEAAPKKGRAAKAQPRKPKKAPPATLHTAEDLTENQVRRLAAATAKLASPDLSIRADGRKEIEEIAGAHAARVEALRKDAADQERRCLEILRQPPGENDNEAVVEEEVELGRWVRNNDGFLILEKGKPVYEVVKATRTRVISRDGLENLMANKFLNGIQYAAGLKYREMYEMADPERQLRSCMGFEVGGRTPLDPFCRRVVKAVQDRAEDNEALVRLDEYVMRSLESQWGVIAAGRAIHALREVAGKGKTVRQIASGSAHRKHLLSLLDALDAVADYKGLQ